MRAGDLRERITIQWNNPTKDSFSAVKDNWTKLADLWACVETLSGREYIAQNVAAAALARKVTIRERDDVTPAMRILYDESILDINAVIDNETTGFMTLMCTEQVAP